MEFDDEPLCTKRGCCFWINIDRSNGGGRLNWWYRVTTTSEKEDVMERRHCWSKGVDVYKGMKEWSEIVAGPKWKTFIRRFNKNRPMKQGKFQYDPLSYALNFDEGNGGHNGNLDDEDCAFRDFSSRFVAVPMTAKSSMDLGKDGPTTFT